MRMNGEMAQNMIGLKYFQHKLSRSCDRSKDRSKLLSAVVIIIGQILFHHRLLNVITKLYMILEDKRKQRISIVKIAIGVGS